MAIRSSWATQNSGPTGTIDVEEARLAVGALVYPHTSTLKGKSGFRPGPGASPGLVTATGTPDGFVHVAPFQLLLQGGRATAPGVYLAAADAIVDINILAVPADPTNPRNDLVIARQSDTFYADANSDFEVTVVRGTPAGTPADPTITGSGDHVTLARVRVDANATTIVSGKITDLRTTGHAKSLAGGLYSVALGGILPVASATERNALTGLYPGLAAWITDVKQAHIYNGTAWQPISPYRDVQTLSGTTGSWTFSNIPSTLRTIQIATTVRADPSSNASELMVRINGDTGNNYRHNSMFSQNNAVPAQASVIPTNSARINVIPAGTATAGVYGAGLLTITGWDAPHAAHLGGVCNGGFIDATGNQIIYAGSIVYLGAAPYTSITLLPISGSFVTQSEFHLVGWE